MKAIINLTFLFLVCGCATNPSVEKNISTSDYCKQMYGKRFDFRLSSEEFHWKRGGDFGLHGLERAYEPLKNNCRRDGGTLTPTSKKYISGWHLPTILNCVSENTLYWSVNLNFSNPVNEHIDWNQTNWFSITLNPVLSMPNANSQK